jgi:hypothetical protein
MTRLHTGLLLVAAAAVAVLPAAASAQAPVMPPPAGADVDPQAAQWLSEIQQIHQRLSQLQEKALQDPALSAQRDSLGVHIRVAMETIDPALPQRMDRIAQMDGEAAAAEARKDDAALTQLRAEAQQIERQFLSAQQQALQQPALAAEVEAFQTQLEQKILATDPEAPQLLARFQELERKLAEAAGGQ